MSIIISNIQRMCMHDGPGLRTTVFLKGCSIHCPWCSNPENMSYRRQYFYNESKCLKQNGTCFFNPECIALEDIKKLYAADCTNNWLECQAQALGIFGKEYTTDQLYNILIKDKKYWKNNGGITFSGGEALMHMEKLEPLMQMLKEDNVHLAVETSLFIDEKLLKIAMKCIDFFYVDVKVLGQSECKNILGGDINQYKKNVGILCNSNKEIIFRIPCSEEYTLTKGNIELLKEFLQKYNDVPVEIFQLHKLAQSKYDSLGKDMWKSNRSSEEKMATLMEWMKSTGIFATKISI